MTPHPTQAFIAVIGGGPAGLMAAEKLAAQGHKVTIYDRMPTLARKFQMAGRGGLNLTHSEDLSQLIARYGTASNWLRPAIEAFPPDALRNWCHELGQETFVGSSGRVFPKTMKASPLLRGWLKKLEGLGVAFALRHEWHGWDEKGYLIFRDPVGKEISVLPNATILALGGASWSRLGSDGGWIKFLPEIDIAPLRPSNCGFIAPWSAHFSDHFAGKPIKPARFSFGDYHLQGEAMITQQGIEGGAIYALSAAIRDEIAEKNEAILSIDLRLGRDVESITSQLGKPRGSQSLSTYLRKAVGLSPVAIGLMRESLQGTALPTAPRELAMLIKQTKIKLTATTAIDRAISSAGGIRRDELDTYFMLKKKPGIFAIGEMLDWEAPTGGYLLQACFSMGVTAAVGAEAYLADKNSSQTKARASQL